MRSGLGRVLGSAVLVAAGLLTVPVLLGAPPAADAIPQEGVVVDQPEVVREYPPIVGVNPTREVFQYPAPICDILFAPACDTIHVVVEPPAEITEDTGYLSLTISLEWDDPTGTNTDDLDMYLWDDVNGAFVGRSVSTRNPEKATVESRDFYVVVNHYAGVNAGYTLRFTMNVEIFEKPFELPEPPLPGGEAGGFGLPTGVPVIDAGPGAGVFDIPGPADDAAGVDAPRAAVGKIELVPAPRNSVDIDFDAIQRQVQEAEAAAADVPGDGGPGAAVWFWLVLLPIAAVGSAGAWLVRRRPASLKR